MQQVAAKDPNPSGSATAVAKRINRNTNAVKEVLGAQAQREALVKALIEVAQQRRLSAQQSSAVAQLINQIMSGGRAPFVDQITAE